MFLISWRWRDFGLLTALSFPAGLTQAGAEKHGTLNGMEMKVVIRYITTDYFEINAKPRTVCG